ncbi:IclR family transcriptional regulator [Brucella gallinifaecis]|uniref:IclR family transcriptional regulator n=1 Tax=Brucella gallinifaecis TaxID=215590 RepID=A0A502BKQ1_9HYPH|nr:IclR family transcriptional regulator [Brucella gallinifaecis]TPF74685.1 IclR family transcriptional regulator [Brucella gallinifaecis]
MQSLDRFAKILKALAGADKSGLRLSQVARLTGLGLPTTLRLLEALVKQGFAEADRDQKSFSLGPELVFLGMAATRSFPVAQLARDALLNLAGMTGDTAYLTLRSANHTICLDRVLGSYPVQTMTIQVGDQRPLGVGAASIAILATLTEAEADEILLQNQEAFKQFPDITTERIRNDVNKARTLGYAHTQNHVVPDVWAVAHAITDPFGKAIGAVTTAAIASRFKDDRLLFLHETAKIAATEIEKRITSHPHF